MKRFLVSFAVAVFIGLIRAQTTTTDPKKDQNIAFVPAYATPASQSAVNKQMSEAYGTPQYGGEDFGGWGSLEGYSMDPQAYLD